MRELCHSLGMAGTVDNVERRTSIVNCSVSEDNESLKVRVSGPNNAPTLIYLPGLHGDWTLVRGFRDAFNGRVRFVELTYPRSLQWSLDDYALGVERELTKQGIMSGWLLGESFSSQVVWTLIARGNFKVEGAILAGGFVRYPMRFVAAAMQSIMPRIPVAGLRAMLRSYAWIARFRYRKSLPDLQSLNEFVSRRTELDWQAMTFRVGLLRQNDPREIARNTRIPVYALTGLFDPVVPWFGVKPWLRKYCPGFRGSRVIGRGDHVVLGTAPEAAVEQVLQWMGRQEDCP